MTGDSRVSRQAAMVFTFMIGAALPTIVSGRAPFGVAVGIACLAILLWRPWPELAGHLREHFRTLPGLVVLAVFLSWLPNLLVSPDPLRSSVAVVRTLLLVGGTVIIAGAMMAAAEVAERVLKVFVVFATIALVIALLSFHVWPEFYWMLTLKGYRSLAVGTSLKGFSSLVVFFIPLLVLAGHRFGWKWALASGVLCAGYLMFAWDNHNRSAIAGVIVVATAAGLTQLAVGGSKKRSAVLLALVSAALVAVLVWLYMARGELPDPSGGEREWLFPLWLIDFPRQVIWATTWDYAMQSPWVGLGANTINFVAGADRVIDGTYGLHVIPSHPHNWVLEIFAETGVLGLAPLLLLIGMLSVRMVRRYKQTGSPAMLAAIGVFAGYWGSGLFSFSYWSAWWQLSFMLALAICFAIDSHTPERGQSDGLASR